VLAIVSALFGALIAALRPRATLVVEVLVLRQQLAVLKRASPTRACAIASGGGVQASKQW
jgi:hypothetical protein